MKDLKEEYNRQLKENEYRTSLIEFYLAKGEYTVENMPGLGLGVRSGDGIIMKASREWKTKMGLDPEEMKGKCFTEFLAPEDKQKTWELFTGITVNNEEIHGDYDFSNHYLNSKGEKVRLLWLSRLIDNDKFVVANARIVNR